MKLRLEQRCDCINKRVNNFFVNSDRLVNGHARQWCDGQGHPHYEAWTPTLRGAQRRPCTVSGVQQQATCSPAASPAARGLHVRGLANETCLNATVD